MVTGRIFIQGKEYEKPEEVFLVLPRFNDPVYNPFNEADKNQDGYVSLAEMDHKKLAFVLMGNQSQARPVVAKNLEEAKKQIAQEAVFNLGLNGKTIEEKSEVWMDKMLHGKNRGEKWLAAEAYVFEIVPQIKEKEANHAAWTLLSSSSFNLHCYLALLPKVGEEKLSVHAALIRRDLDSGEMAMMKEARSGIEPRQNRRQAYLALAQRFPDSLVETEAYALKQRIFSDQKDERGIDRLASAVILLGGLTSKMTLRASVDAVEILRKEIFGSHYHVREEGLKTYGLLAGRLDADHLSLEAKELRNLFDDEKAGDAALTAYTKFIMPKMKPWRAKQEMAVLTYFYVTVPSDIRAESDLGDRLVLGRWKRAFLSVESQMGLYPFEETERKMFFDLLGNSSGGGREQLEQAYTARLNHLSPEEQEKENKRWLKTGCPLCPF